MLDTLKAHQVLATEMSSDSSKLDLWDGATESNYVTFNKESVGKLIVELQKIYDSMV